MARTLKRLIPVILLLGAGVWLVLKNNPDIFKQKSFESPFSVNYKTLEDGQTLRLKIYRPKASAPTKGYPTVVFFHGGGWKSGHIGQFYRNAELITAYGLQAVLVEYRTEESHKTNPFEALKDARSAMRYVKEQSQDLQIDIDKIVALGSSAGAHLALGTVLLDAYNDPADDQAIDPTPSAIVAFSAIVDCGPEGFGPSTVKSQFETFSPIHNIKPSKTKLLMLHGDRDKYTSTTTVQLFTDTWKDQGNYVELELYPGQQHGFTDYQKNKAYFDRAMNRTLQFLMAQEFIETQDLDPLTN